MLLRLFLSTLSKKFSSKVLPFARIHRNPPFISNVFFSLFSSWEVEDLSNLSFFLTFQFTQYPSRYGVWTSLRGVTRSLTWRMHPLRKCPGTEIWCKLAILSLNIQLLQWKTVDKHRKDWSAFRVEHRKIPPLTSSPHDLTNRVRKHFGESSALTEWETPR